MGIIGIILLTVSIICFLGLYIIHRGNPKNKQDMKILTGVGSSCLVVGLVICLFFSSFGILSNRDTDAWICAKDLVQSKLTYDASSAKFGSQSSATITDLGNNKYMVKGTVEAKNAYGTYVQKTFTATFTLTKSGYEDGYVSFK